MADDFYQLDPAILDGYRDPREQHRSLMDGGSIGVNATVPIRATAAGAGSTLLELEAPKDDPQAVSVTVGPALVANAVGQPSGPFNTDATDIFARLTWGSGGARFVAEADINNGFTANLFGSYLRVDGVAVGPLVGPAPPPPAIVNAAASYYPRGGNLGPLVRTVNVGPVAAGATTAGFAIPAFARRMFIGVPEIGIASRSFAVQFFRDQAAALPITITIYGSAIRGVEDIAVGSLIPQGARFFTFFNNSGNLWTNVSVMFELYL